MLPAFSYHRPRTLEQAVAALTAGDAVLHAGGSDLLGTLRDGVQHAGRVVSLGALDELRGLSEAADGSLRIGAMTTIAALAAEPLLRRSFRALAEAAQQVASPQLRNQGTLGGNLCQKPRCWYYRGDFHCLRKGGDLCYAFAGENRYHAILGGDTCYMVHPSDTAAALIALDAVARVTGPSGARSLPVEKLHVPPAEDPQRELVLEPGEILTGVSLPAPAPGLRSSYRKLRERGAWDFAVVGVAHALRLDGELVSEARVVLSGVAPIPWRARAAEAALVGRRLDPGTIRSAAAAAVAGAEPLSDNAYKLPMASGLVEEELERLTAG